MATIATNEPNVDTNEATETSGVDGSRGLNAIVNESMDRLRQRSQLNKLWGSVLRSLVISLALLAILCLLTVLVGVSFYVVNRNGSTDSGRYRELIARRAEFDSTLNEVLQLLKVATAGVEDGRLISRLARLRQLGRNNAYKHVNFFIRQHELRPTFSQSMRHAVTLVTLIGYGDIVGASELQYFCASLCMLVVVPVWYMYHHQLYHLFYYLQLYCHRGWIQPESLSNRTMMVLWAIRIRNANMYKSSRFYLSNLVLMILLFLLCLSVFAITEQAMSLSDQLWLTVQSIFHIGLGDVPPKAHWLVIFPMISTCFLIYFQCFSFVVPQQPSLRLSRIINSDYA